MSRDSTLLAPQADWSAAVRPRSRLGHTIEVHEAIGSTNDRARELLVQAGVDGSVVLAEEQTAGRGRRGRTWLSPRAVNLTMSVALQPALAAADAWQLGLATALATRAACAAVLPDALLGLKWPNDVIAPDGRKVGGLLLEVETTGERMSAAVLGIGINVNWRRVDMPPEIAAQATSLREISGGDVDRVVLLDALLDALDEEVARVERGLSPLARYRDACVTIGQQVTVTVTGEAVFGHAVGLDEVGSLLVQTPSGRVALTTGEVASVRPGAPE